MTVGNPGGLPRYKQLTTNSAGGRQAWNVFGPMDQVGLINLQTPDRVVEASRLVKVGRVFSLSPSLDFIDPPMFNRRLYEHHLLKEPSGFDDYLDRFYPQASAHWDSLAHVPHGLGQYYNGVGQDLVANLGRNSIENWGARGIVGRAVLLDLEGAGRMDLDRAFTVADLESARAAAGIEIREGDVLLLHTGFLAWYARQSPETRSRFADETTMRAPGLERSEAMAEFLWDLHVCAIGADNPSVEQWPIDNRSGLTPFESLHNVLIGGFGMALGELWWLHDLAQDCLKDEVFEMLFVSAPLRLPGGIGSPANALAIK